MDFRNQIFTTEIYYPDLQNKFSNQIYSDYVEEMHFFSHCLEPPFSFEKINYFQILWLSLQIYRPSRLP